MTDDYASAEITAPGEVTFKPLPLTDPGEEEVLIRVKAAAICGSDLHLFKGRHPSAALPSAAGHEIAGLVTAVGPLVATVRPGDRVTVEPVIVCDACRACRSGAYNLCANISFQYRQGRSGFAEYFYAPARWVHLLPDNISYEDGALVEPLAVAVHAVGKAAVPPGAKVAIIGDGAIGLLLLMLLENAGVGWTGLAGIQESRLKLALELGADVVFNNLTQDVVRQMMRLTEDAGVDVSFEAVGLASTLTQSLEVLRKGGRAVMLGIFEEPSMNFGPNIFIQKEITLVGSQGYCHDFPTAIKLISDKSITPGRLVTHRLPMGALGEGFERLLNPNSGAVKVVMVND